mgnify:CR=1 FL=1
MALVSFDLDGVLQRNPFHAGRPQGVFGHIQRELSPYLGGDPEEAFRETLRQILAEHRARMQAGRYVEAYDWDDVVRLVAGRFGYPGHLDVPALVRHYVTLPGMVWLYPGARDCLQALADRGHTLVAITNGYRVYQEPILVHLGIREYFADLVTPDAVGTVKPMPAMFRAAEPLGSPRIHVGDTLPHDVAGPRRAGWMAVYIVQPGTSGYEELPDAARDLPPWRRPEVAVEWLRQRLERDRRLNGHPPVDFEECIPDAIVTGLHEVPETVAHLLQ